MDSLKRVFTALSRKEPDRVPILEWEIHNSVINAILPGTTLYDFIEQAEDIGLKQLRFLIIKF